MLTCYLLTVSRLSAPSAAEKPMCYLTVAEDENEAVANVAEGYRDFFVPGQRPCVSGSLRSDEARRLGIPMDRKGHVASAFEYIG